MKKWILAQGMDKLTYLDKKCSIDTVQETKEIVLEQQKTLTVLGCYSSASACRFVLDQISEWLNFRDRHVFIMPSDDEVLSNYACDF